MSDDDVRDFRDFFDTAPSHRTACLVNGRLVNGRVKHGAFIPDDATVKEEMAEPMDGGGVEERHNTRSV